MSTYFVNGVFTDSDESLISINDLIVLRGYGVFDFLVSYNRTPFMLREHIERLENSAKQIGLQLNHSHDEIYDAVIQTIDKNKQFNEMNIRIIYTGGESDDGVTPLGNGKLIVMISEKKKHPPAWYSHGVKVISEMVERQMTSAKRTDYLSALMAQKKAREVNAIEAIYTDRNMNIQEGTTSNIFFFKDNRLITTSSDILPGITRSAILNLSDDLSFEKELRNITLDEIDTFDEVFISASNKEIVPVIQFDDIIIGNGKPGPNTLKLMDSFNELTRNYGKD